MTTTHVHPIHRSLGIDYEYYHTSRKRLRRSQTRDPSLEKKDFFFFFFTFQMILNKVHFFSLWVFFVYGIWQRPWHLGAALYPFGSGAPLRNGSAAPRMLPVCHLFSKYALHETLIFYINFAMMVFNLWFCM